MDMAPWRNEPGATAGARRTQPGCQSQRALDALQEATQATLMMGFAWPAIAVIPFFLAPPFWIMAGIGRAGAK